MDSIDWTQVITTALSGSGILAVLLAPLVAARIHKGRQHSKGEEAVAVATTQTPAIPYTADSSSALGIAQQALRQAEKAMHEAESARKRERATDERVKHLEARQIETERKLSILDRSYRILRTWVDDLIQRWPEYRQEHEPPALPPDLH